jgi:hypothetical protein
LETPVTLDAYLPIYVGVEDLTADFLPSAIIGYGSLGNGIWGVTGQNLEGLKLAGLTETDVSNGAWSDNVLTSTFRDKGQLIRAGCRQAFCRRRLHQEIAAPLTTNFFGENVILGVLEWRFSW